MSRVWFGFYRTEPWRSKELVRQTLGICRSIDGFGLGPPNKTVGPEDFAVDESGAFDLYWQDGSGRVSVGFIYDAMPKCFLDISMRRQIFVPDDEEGEYQGLTGAVLELVRALAIEYEPYYVMSPNPEPEIGPDPTDVIPMTTKFELERIPWFGVYSTSLIDDLGGRDHVMGAPAWRVEELETGSILLIRTRAPWAHLGRDHPVDRYLLDGEDT